MRSDFAAFILAHGRPDKVVTYQTLRRSGYTGRVFLVVDDLDKTKDRYVKKFGDEVLVFSKAAIALTFDEADNFPGFRGVVYARNACWDLARAQGIRYFIELDDDYSSFQNHFNSRGEWVNKSIDNLDAVFGAMVQALIDIPSLRTIALAQGGDIIGGNEGLRTVGFRRKVMNSFVCDVERPFQFYGRMNEDVNPYVTEGQRGGLYLTTMAAKLNQAQTQANSGGLTELYLDSGTYVKSFYSVMHCPSAVKVGVLDGQRSDAKYRHTRIHHEINWDHAVPKIIRATHRKPRPSDA